MFLERKLNQCGSCVPLSFLFSLSVSKLSFLLCKHYLYAIFTTRNYVLILDYRSVAEPDLVVGTR